MTLIVKGKPHVHTDVLGLPNNVVDSPASMNPRKMTEVLFSAWQSSTSSNANKEEVSRQIRDNFSR